MLHCGRRKLCNLQKLENLSNGGLMAHSLRNAPRKGVRGSIESRRDAGSGGVKAGRRDKGMGEVPTEGRWQTAALLDGAGEREVEPKRTESREDGRRNGGGFEFQVLDELAVLVVVLVCIQVPPQVGSSVQGPSPDQVLPSTRSRPVDRLQ
jgi:hypothetical protein